MGKKGWVLGITDKYRVFALPKEPFAQNLTSCG
jgi:hypothetical protein